MDKKNLFTESDKKAFDCLYKELLRSQLVPFNERPIPITAVIYGENLNYFCSSNNSKTKERKADQATHAEHIIIDEIKKIILSKKKKLDFSSLKILITIPPCSKCLEEIYNLGIKNIYYISDFSLGNKIKDYDLKILEEINISHFNFPSRTNKKKKFIIDTLNQWIIFQYVIRWVKSILEKKQTILKVNHKKKYFMNLINKKIECFNINEKLEYAKINLLNLNIWLKKINREILIYKDIFQVECRINCVSEHYILPINKFGKDSKKNIIYLCDSSQKEIEHKTKNLKINNIKFSISNENGIGVYKIEKSTLNKQEFEYLYKNGFVEKISHQSKKEFIYIDSNKVKEYFLKIN